MKKEYPVLYTYSTNGVPQQWQIVTEGDSYYTIEGQVGGKLTTSQKTICYGKNIGKKNETTPSDQATSQALAKIQKKRDKGYDEEISNKKKFFEPMLAQEFEASKIRFDVYDVYVQPKLDGLRAVNEHDRLMSRNGKPFVACPHLYQNEVTLDGELYSHEYHDDFNKIVSLCKRATPTEEELAESEEKVRYWVYDFPNKIGWFSERYEALRKWHAGYLKKCKQEGKKPTILLTPTHKITSLKELEMWNEKFLEDGFEGTIVRLDNAPYENKRSKQLLKYKQWQDEDFEIIGYEEGTGNRTGTIGFFHMKHDQDRRADFKSNVKGDHNFLRSVWKDRDSYIGKTATVKYFNRTPIKDDGTGNKPRFPYIIKIAREDYE